MGQYLEKDSNSNKSIGDGNDVLLGGAGVDQDELFEDFYGNDVFYGFEGDDTFHIYSGNDVVHAGDGDDIIKRESDGGDTIFGGDGDDSVYRVDAGFSVIDGGEGSDTVYYNQSGQLARVINLEKGVSVGIKPNTLDDNLVAHYSFNSSQLGNNEIGINYDGVVDGTTIYADGIDGQAAYFDGDDRIQVDDFKNFEWGEELTVSVWHKRDGEFGNYQGVVNNGYYSNGSWEIECREVMMALAMALV